MILSDIICPDTAFSRSVNLERDMGDETTLRQYRLTDKGLEIISRLVSALKGERVSAWSLTGPFGMGKSSFANFLLALCGPENERETQASRKILMEKDRGLYRDLVVALDERSPLSKGLFRVPITSSFESINQSLLNGLLRAARKASLQKGNKRTFNKLIPKIVALSEQQFLDTLSLAELFKEAGKVYGAPVAIIIDEFGKNLEFMARHPAQGDLYILQVLAESKDIYLWVCLHQAFDEYASSLTARQLQEWGKIQGRFEDISFIETKRQMISFITSAIARKSKYPLLDKALEKWAKAFLCIKDQVNLPELNQWGPDEISLLYPLHPLVALLLPELSIRFAQNDRTLFAFLCGGEPRALPAFLASNAIEPEKGLLFTYGPELLYDYFLTSITQALINRPEFHRLFEIYDLIERSRNLSSFHQAILKVIGLLNLVSGPSGFRASEKMLGFAFMRPLEFASVGQIDLGKALEELKGKGTLIYREYADEYRLWEGTDFDVVSAVQETKSHMASQPLDEVLEQTFPLNPFIASRHSYRTGTLRQFKRRWCSYQALREKLPSLSADGADGLILYCFGNESRHEGFPSKTEDSRPVIVAYVDCEEQIREMVIEAAASKTILRESPELARDGVARREVRFRLRIAEERLGRFLGDVYAPENPDVSWRVLNQPKALKSHRDLAKLLSMLCDETFCYSPIIRNELVNRCKLSSAAAKARNELIKAMLSYESEENLGLRGNGPEVAIYRTMLRATGLHRIGEDGRWRFFPPGSDSSFFEAWNALSRTVEGNGEDVTPILSLIDLLRHPPFGIKDGPILILLCLFLTVNSDEIALYNEGVFVLSLTPEDMELMAKRPEAFSIKRFAPMGIQARIFEIYRSLLNTCLVIEDRHIRNTTMVAVVGPLVHFARSLPPYTIYTISLTREAQNVRHVLCNVHEPISLLFEELPKAVGLHVFGDEKLVHEGDIQEFQIRLRSCLIELADAYNKLITNIQLIISEAFNANDGSIKLSQQFRAHAMELIPRCSDEELKPLLTALTKSYNSERDWTVSVAMAVMKRPVAEWRDRDLQAFSVQMTDLMRRFKAFEAIVAAEKGRVKRRRDMEPRLVSLTWPDGNTSSEIFWLGSSQSEKLRNALETLRNDLSLTDLKSLFILLGDHLFREG